MSRATAPIGAIGPVILAGILLALTISIGGAGWYTLSASRDALYRDHAAWRETLTRQVAAAMAAPIYSFSPNDGSLALDLLKQDPRVVTIEVYDSLNEMDFVAVHIPGRAGGETFVNEAPVVQDGLTIGHVRLEFNDTALAAELAEKERLFGKVFGLTFLANVIVMFPLLYLRILRPLGRLERQAALFRDQRLDRPFTWTGRDEISRVGQAFEIARVEVVNLIRALEERNAELRTLSTTDRLTGLFNRHMLDEILDAETRRGNRYGTPLAVILVDLDHFKSVNDLHGHQIGDAVLVAVARLLRDHLRDSDSLGRWGGEEFLVVCPGTDAAGAAALAEKLRQALRVHPAPVVGPRTASFGVAAHGRGESANALLTRADDALYAAKSGGRDRVAVADEMTA